MKTFLLPLIFTLTVGLTSLPAIAQEADTTTEEDAAVTEISPAPSAIGNPDLGFNTIKDTLPTSKFEESSWIDIGTQIFNVLNTIVAFLAFFGLLISGVMLITAGGDPEKAEKAKKNIVWVVTGIVIYLLSLYILPVTRGIIEHSFIKEFERQQEINAVMQFQAFFLKMLGFNINVGQ